MSHNIEVTMPLMGEGVHEATLIKWLKKTGDKVTEGEPLLEVSTDKVDTEIEAPSSGFLIATFCEAESTIKVDQVIAQISDDKNAKVITPSQKQNQPKAEVSPKESNKPQPRKGASHAPSGSGVQSTVPQSFAGSVRSSPLVRKLAKEMGVDLRQVTGSGLHGRITKPDLYNFMENGNTRIPLVQPQGSSEVELNPKGEMFRQKTTTIDGKETLEGVVVRREKMSKIRWLTAKHMLESVRVSPHVTTTFEFDLHRIVKHRKATRDQFMKDHGFKLTFTPYFIEAAIQAIKKFPETNASIDGDEILYKDDINIGCAVAIETGLVVPVIKRTNDFKLVDCAKGLTDIATRARSKKLKAEDLKGGTFSITNPGMFGSIHSQPIINQPQVAMLSIGAMIPRLMKVGGEIVERPLCQIGLTFDHRIIDGEGGAKFLAHMKEYLESYPL